MVHGLDTREKSSSDLILLAWFSDPAIQCSGVFGKLWNGRTVFGLYHLLSRVWTHEFWISRLSEICVVHENVFVGSPIPVFPLRFWSIIPLCYLYTHLSLSSKKLYFKHIKPLGLYVLYVPLCNVVCEEERWNGFRGWEW